MCYFEQKKDFAQKLLGGLRCEDRSNRFQDSSELSENLFLE